MFKKRLAYWAILIGIPVLAVGLWLGSGRERLSKHFRMVSVAVPNDLFGDADVVTESVPGPIFGYYVGLDLVIAAICLSIAVAGLAWWLGRRRAARKEPT